MSCLPCTCSVCCCMSLGGRGLRLVIGYSDQASTVSQATTLELGHCTQMMQFTIISFLSPSCPLCLLPGNRTASTPGPCGELRRLFACYLHDLEACLVSHLLPKDVRSARPCFMWFMGIMGLLEQATPGVGVRTAGLAFSLIYCNRQNEKTSNVTSFSFLR